MAKETFKITIDSILGGISPTTNFSAPEQFLGSLGINPNLPVRDLTNGLDPTTFSIRPSGLLRPSPLRAMTSTGISRPVWMCTPRGTTVTYVVDTLGSCFTVDISTETVTALSDGGALNNMFAGSVEYYDNYLYFPKNTDIARYGPLDGTPGFTGTYWTGTLGLTALTKITYPLLRNSSSSYSNITEHQMLRHSDGKLYIADTVDNQGTLHYIKTTKTAVEGDTNNGSKYDALRFGYGLVITALESYGKYIVLALAERDGTAVYSGRNRKSRAKIAFWDTTSQNVNDITWVEFPDNLVTSIVNLNGTLYFFSTLVETANGFRLQRYVGGSSFEEIFKSGAGVCPYTGAVDAAADKIYWGSRTLYPEESGCVYEYDSKYNSVQVIMSTPITTTTVTALTMAGMQPFSTNLSVDLPLIGWTGSTHGLSHTKALNTVYGTATSMWWSQLKKIGQPFKITKIRIPLAQAMAVNMSVTPTIYTDDGGGTTYTGGSYNGLAVLNNTNFSGKSGITLRPENLTGEHNFWLELRWTGTALCVVSLPIIIEGEYLND